MERLGFEGLGKGLSQRAPTFSLNHPSERHFPTWQLNQGSGGGKAKPFGLAPPQETPRISRKCCQGRGGFRQEGATECLNGTLTGCWRNLAILSQRGKSPNRLCGPKCPKHLGGFLANPLFGIFQASHQVHQGNLPLAAMTQRTKRDDADSAVLMLQEGREPRK